MMRSRLSRVVLSFVGAGALAVFAVNCAGGDSDSTGTAGTGGGSAGTGGGSCDVPKIFADNSCAIAGCHAASKPAAGLDMVTAGWETRLVGKAAGGATDGTPSLCGGAGRVLLTAGSNPATGLFLDKLKSTPPCGEKMPNVPLLELSNAEIACVQAWANNLTK
jgi:hypothetical protein